MIFSDLKEVLLLADVSEALPEGVREAGAVIRSRGDEAELPKEGVSPALDPVEVIREKLGRVYLRVFFL